MVTTFRVKLLVYYVGAAGLREGQAYGVPAYCNVFHFIIQPPSILSSVDQKCTASQAQRDIITF